MPSTPIGASGTQPGRRGFAGRLLVGIGKRVYALALIALVLWLSWLAFRYLLVSLIFAAPPPPQIVGLPLRANEAMLAAGAPAFAGVQAVENPRAPLGHYHRIGAWFEPDRFNDCTRSGCHAPLPHGRNKADRAFLNMHATSIHCGVCHMQTEQRPLELVWYELETGHATDPPVLLTAFAWLEAAKRKAAATLTEADQREIVRLLRAAARRAGNGPALHQVATHLAAVRVESEDFPRLLEAAQDVVQQHLHGEYGAKLALADAATGRQRLRHPGSERAVRAYLSRKDTLTEHEQQSLLGRVHPLRRQPTLHCTDCHTPTGGLVDLSRVGYPAARIQQLVQPLIMRAIEHIVAGEVFQMPTFVGPGEQSQPASDESPKQP